MMHGLTNSRFVVFVVVVVVIAIVVVVVGVVVIVEAVGVCNYHCDLKY